MSNLGLMSMKHENESTAPIVARNPSLRYVICSPNEVFVRHGARSQFMTTLQDGSRSDALGALFAALEQPRTVEELITLVPEAARGDIADVVEELLADGILVVADTPRYESHAAVAWKTSAAEHTVAVVGDGALAGRISSELKNVDLPFVPAAGTSLDELRAVFSQASIVVAACDQLSPHFLLTVDDVARETGTRWLPAILDGSHAFVGPWIRPHEGPCYREVISQLEATTVRHAEYLATRDHPDAAAGGAPQPHLSVVSGWAALAVMAFVGGVPSLVDRVMVLDLERLGIDTTEIMQLPRCPACYTTPSMHTFQ